MRRRRTPAVPPLWLPFIGRRLGLAKSLFHLSIDPEDLDVHHVFPTISSLGGILGDTKEFEPRAGGAGISFDDAINRAMGELLERYAAFAFEGTGRIAATCKALRASGRKPVPLAALRLFTREQLLKDGFPFTEFTEEVPVAWFEGTDLLSGSAVYVPGQLLSLGYEPGPNEVSTCFYGTSSGCALATSAQGALAAGLLECIERDAVMLRWYARLAPPLLQLDPAEVLGRPLRLPSRGLEIRFHDMTVDGEVPVVGVSCVEKSGRPCFFDFGSAAALDTLTAARKALIEAGQERPFLKFLANAGEAPRAGDLFKDFDSNVRFFAEPSNAAFVEWFFQNSSVSARYFPAVPGASEPGAVLDVLLDRCRRMGLTPNAFDMSTPDLRDHGLFVYRVFVPELIPLCLPFAPFLGHPRLARSMTAAIRDGLAVSIPDWVPHPYA
jgi:ribosomal protein S12 methylthiotransferase accessory factor